MKKKPASEMKVAILGAGPSAAYGVAALRRLGVGHVEVFTDQINSPPRGAFWFHELPDDTKRRVKPTPIVTFGLGTGRRYLRNQHGYTKEQSSSFPERPLIQWGYDPWEVWAELWGDTKPNIGVRITGDNQVKAFGEEYDVVFHTFPSQLSIQAQPPLERFPVVLYPTEDLMDPATLRLEEWWLYKRAARDYLWEMTGHYSMEHNICVYNGTDYLPWVRTTRRWGKVYVELPARWAKTQVSILKSLDYALARGIHPDTEPWTQKISDNIYPLGRFAQWNKKTLTHHSYSRVLGICSSYITGESSSG